jgi:hypothetical protein
VIKFVKRNENLLLRYTPERDGADWVDADLLNHRRVTIRRIFSFDANRLVENDEKEKFSSEDDRSFVLGVTEGDLYRIDRIILGIRHDLFLSKKMAINEKTFIANRDISIFRKIDEIVDESIVVGGNTESSIPIKKFQELLRNFSTSTELTHYTHARIARVLKDYFETMSDAQTKLSVYLNKKQTIKPESRVKFIQGYEPKKFEYVRDELKILLQDSEGYNEKNWRKLIVDFLLLIFPKYIAVLENLHIKDFYSNPSKVKDRYIDLTLIDANGTLDIVEIKKPFANCILSQSKYRDNYTPRTELSGSVMQIEKYLFHLSKWGREGEKEILKKRSAELPSGFEIKVTNPKAMIILGRDTDFANDQKFDFEIIRRKYANVIDIMTYDNLLRRLDNIIAMIHHNFSNLGSKGGQE